MAQGAKNTKKRVLVADPNVELLKSVGAALQKHGFEVLVARDGSKALEASVLKTPDMVLIDEDCPLIDAQRFGAILRANPRTENTPLIVMSARDTAEVASYGYLEGHIQKPFNLDELISRLEATAQKIETARSVRAADRAIVGNLAQIPLVDLLQIFSMNRKSGVLALRTKRGDGDISVREGRIVDARVGKAKGMKALFRLMTEVEGEFSFTPGKDSGEISIDDKTDSLIMEGLRQSDELVRMLPELPPLDATVERTSSDAPPENLHPITQTLLEILAQPQRLNDLFDAVPFTDFEAAQALAHLIAAQLVRERKGRDPKPAAEPLLPEALVLMLRGYLHRATPGSVSLTRPRIMLVADDPRRITKLIAGLRGLAEFRPETRGSARFGFGTLGTLPAADDLALELIALPMRSDLLPAAVPLAVGALGVICLSSGAEDSASLVRFREAMTGRLGVPWLEVTVDKAQADATFESEPRAVRGILAAFCRTLSKS